MHSGELDTPMPLNLETERHKGETCKLDAIHIFISPIAHKSQKVTTYHIWYNNSTLTHSIATGADHTQALCWAVQTALTDTFTLQSGPTYLWLRPAQTAHKLLTLKPHRDIHITYDTHMLIHNHLDTFPTNTVDICNFQKDWLGTPLMAEIKQTATDQNPVEPTERSDAQLLQNQLRFYLWNAWSYIEMAWVYVPEVYCMSLRQEYKQ